MVELEKHRCYSAFWLTLPWEGTSVGSKGKLISSCVYFSFVSFFFFPFSDVSVCSQHLGQGLGSVWLYLKHRGKRLVPAPLSPNRLFAWCGCQVDALASFPRTNEFARICVWKKACFSRFFFFLGGITVDGCMPDADHLSCQKGTSLDSTMNY